MRLTFYQNYLVGSGPKSSVIFDFFAFINFLIIAIWCMSKYPCSLIGRTIAF